MSKRICLSVSIFVVSVLGALFLGCPGGAPGGGEGEGETGGNDYLPLAVGNSWTYLTKGGDFILLWYADALSFSQGLLDGGAKNNDVAKSLQATVEVIDAREVHGYPVWDLRITTNTQTGHGAFVLSGGTYYATSSDSLQWVEDALDGLPDTLSTQFTEFLPERVPYGSGRVDRTLGGFTFSFDVTYSAGSLADFMPLNNQWAGLIDMASFSLSDFARTYQSASDCLAKRVHVDFASWYDPMVKWINDLLVQYDEPSLTSDDKQMLRDQLETMGEATVTGWILARGIGPVYMGCGALQSAVIDGQKILFR